MNEHLNVDPSNYDDPDIDRNTEFFKFGDLQKHFEDKYARPLGGVAFKKIEEVAE